MTHYLIRVLDNTLPAALVFSLLLRLAQLADRKGQRAFLRYGIATGAAAALVYAVLKRTTGFAVREYYDLGVLAPSLLLQVGMLIALWRPFAEGRELGAGARAGIALLPALLTAYVLPSLLLYPFDFSVGMESVFNTEVLSAVAGYCLGLLLVVLLTLSLHRVAGKLPRRLLLTFFCALLLIFFAKQGLEAIQILVARNMVPRYPRLMSLVLFTLSNVNWFPLALMGITAFLTAALALRIRLEPLRPGNPAVRRKQRAERRSVYRHCLCIALCLLFSGLTSTVVRAYAAREVELSPPLEIVATDGKLLLPLASVNDGNLHRFQYKTARGTFVRFLVIKKSETAYGVGLDACDICGPSGYYQREDQVVCKLCDVVMNKSTIGFPGGCNPVPLRFAISQGKMVILAADLEAEEERFR